MKILLGKVVIILTLVYRLFDVLLSESRLTIVFEYCDQDLKKYFDSCNGEIDQKTVKVKFFLYILVFNINYD